MNLRAGPSWRATDGRGGLGVEAENGVLFAWGIAFGFFSDQRRCFYKKKTMNLDPQSGWIMDTPWHLGGYQWTPILSVVLEGMTLSGTLNLQTAHPEPHKYVNR